MAQPAARPEWFRFQWMGGPEPDASPEALPLVELTPVFAAPPVRRWPAAARVERWRWSVLPLVEKWAPGVRKSLPSGPHWWLDFVGSRQPTTFFWIVLRSSQNLPNHGRNVTCRQTSAPVCHSKAKCSFYFLPDPEPDAQRFSRRRRTTSPGPPHPVDAAADGCQFTAPRPQRFGQAKEGRENSSLAFSNLWVCFSAGFETTAPTGFPPTPFDRTFGCGILPPSACKTI